MYFGQFVVVVNERLPIHSSWHFQMHQPAQGQRAELEPSAPVQSQEQEDGELAQSRGPELFITENLLEEEEKR